MTILTADQQQAILEEEGYCLVCENPFEIEDSRGYLVKGETAKRIMNSLAAAHFAKKNDVVEKPRIITLCGSARFEPAFKLWNEVLSLAGHTVFSLAVYPSDKAGVKTWYTEDEKDMLDLVHKNKIAASDAIVVLNQFGYVGESRMSEIAVARALNKRIYALESWGKGMGITPAYCEIYKACMAIIPEYRGSPIDSTPWAGFRYPFDLLGQAGEKRTRLVTMINAFKEHDLSTMKLSGE